MSGKRGEERNGREVVSESESARDDRSELLEDLLAGNHRALARTITKIEDRAPGYRELVSDLHAHTGDADVIGITGSPGSGKSTLVDRMAEHYRAEGLTVGIIGIDPSSPFTGGAVLGDRIRMSSTTGDMEVFFRSMSARGSLGGLSTATADAVKALDAFGKDKVIIETVGAGQNEIDIVKTADTVCVLVPPGSGDDVQMLKAGILEIGDLFVVNKADLDGADRTVMELREMIEGRSDRLSTLDADHHDRSDRSDSNGATGEESEGNAAGAHAEELSGDGPVTTVQEQGTDESDEDEEPQPESEPWTPQVLETVAKSGEGVEEFLDTLVAHREYLESSGRLERQLRNRYAEEIRALLREDSSALVERELAARGGIDAYLDRVMDNETDPYAVAEAIVGPLRECVEDRREEE
ncbi:methylmalonyl Co-A mutase-associated GTPase MeaB [Halobacteriales archaeon QS_3_64_16]|nr:MAG: methylmalonyl Co-A mutase-associated GTPase MeaB [Halobacteriales archaeon QS_3_64_16]